MPTIQTPSFNEEGIYTGHDIIEVDGLDLDKAVKESKVALLTKPVEVVLHAVDSSNISAVGHDGTNMYVMFIKGTLYRYYSVDTNIYIGFLTTPSKGKYLNAMVKGKFEASKVN